MATMGEMIERGVESLAERAAGEVGHQVAEVATEAAAETVRGARWSWDWLRKQTGAGDLAGYKDHPANIWGGDEGARIARGVEGMTGGARLALLDIVLGILGMAKKAIAARAGAAKGGADGADA